MRREQSFLHLKIAYSFASISEAKVPFNQPRRLRILNRAAAFERRDRSWSVWPRSRALLDGGMSLQRVRRAWEFLNKKAGLDDHLSEVKLVTDGKSIFKVVRREGEVLDALRQGQMAFFVAIDQVTRQVADEVAEFRRDRDHFVRALREATREAKLGM